MDLVEDGVELGTVRAHQVGGLAGGGLGRLEEGDELGPALGEAVEHDVDVVDRGEQVLVALRRLPRRQREAVVLRYYLDMTEDQAAQAMGVARGTVKSATSRGLAALARMLKENQ